MYTICNNSKIRLNTNTNLIGFAHEIIVITLWLFNKPFDTALNYNILRNVQLIYIYIYIGSLVYF